MSRVVLGVTGSVAAIRTPALVESIQSAGHDVRVVVTDPALYFFEAEQLTGARDGKPPLLHRDRDEWPGSGYRRGDEVLHIALRDWADTLVVAPLDANTLAKLAIGLCDNLLTCLFRAWDFAKPVILAPAMNTRMWESPVTARHLRQMLDDRGDGRFTGDLRLAEAAEVFARHAPRIVLVPPQAKRLACGDFGMGAMAEVIDIAESVREWGVTAQHRQNMN
jgi:phosphopantothenoylcysteine decarboxylase